MKKKKKKEKNMSRDKTWCLECGSDMTWDDKKCKECGYDGTECRLKECDAGDPHLAKRGGPRFPEASCCHQYIIKGKKFCIS